MADAPGPAKAAHPGTWDPLGVTPTDGGANVALWAAGAEAVEFCHIRDDGSERRVELDERTFHVYHGFVSGVRPGDRYGFRVHGPWDPEQGLRFNGNKLLLDPYARAIDGEFRLDPAVFGHVGMDDLTRSELDSAPFVPKSVVVHDDFDWGDDRPPGTSWQDTVI
ncbi:MAG: glycogen debranching enzyme, partial [Candidatus Nanopelagicales bacterium]|nr:glycogen debranching enzyme [Candidatus Nanopelagicales bacterium]